MTPGDSAIEPIGGSREVLIQLAIVTLVIASFIWIGRHSFHGSNAVFAIVLLGALIWSHRKRGDTFRALGFRLDTAPRAALLLVPIAIAVIAVTIAIGIWMKTLRSPSPEVALRMLAKLFVFGIAQQTVLLGFYYRGLARLLRSPWSALLVTALVFAAFHIPNPFLMIVTFVAAIIAAAVYQRSPNLWVNGLTHGLISFVVYYSLPNAVIGGLRVGPDY
jgi:membrane protease YdiL (CAAX protease family)